MEPVGIAKLAGEADVGLGEKVGASVFGVIALLPNA